MFQTTNQISYWGCIPVNKWATTRLLWISPLPHGSMGCYFRYLLNDDQGNVIFAFGLKAPWRGNVHRWQKNYWVIKCNKCIRWMDGWVNGWIRSGQIRYEKMCDVWCEHWNAWCFSRIPHKATAFLGPAESATKLQSPCWHPGKKIIDLWPPWPILGYRHCPKRKPQTHLKDL
jgi:hypothetical protein